MRPATQIQIRARRLSTRSGEESEGNCKRFLEPSYSKRYSEDGLPFFKMQMKPKCVEPALDGFLCRHAADYRRRYQPTVSPATKPQCIIMPRTAIALDRRRVQDSHPRGLTFRGFSRRVASPQFLREV